MKFNIVLICIFCSTCRQSLKLLLRSGGLKRNFTVRMVLVMTVDAVQQHCRAIKHFNNVNLFQRTWTIYEGLASASTKQRKVIIILPTQASDSFGPEKQ